MVNQKKIDYLIKNFPRKIKWVLETFNEGIKDPDIIAFSTKYEEKVYIPEILEFAEECLDMRKINWCGPALKIGEQTRKLVPMYYKYFQLSTDFFKIKIK
jgi:hypothetical protein